MNDVEQYLAARLDVMVERLDTLVRQPTISATGVGMAEGAELIAEMARRCGLTAQAVSSPGHPFVVGEAPPGRSERTLLVTTHFDVQPVEPLDRWDTPPFQVTHGPDGLLLGRGTTDAKGAVVAILTAAEAFLQVHGALPCHLRLLFDGEEEIGSPSMGWLLDTHRADVQADSVVTYDGNSDPGGRAAIYLGSGGLLYVELRVRTGQRDLHANRGALAPNAAWRLIWALASLKDANEQILIDGFADDLAETTPTERAMLAELPYDEQAELAGMGVPRLLAGRGGQNIAEATHILPILGVSGISSGYTGPGAMTVLPAEATAKLYIGLREAQTPTSMLAALRGHLDRRGFDDIEIEVLGETEPASCALDSSIAQATRRASERVTGMLPAIYPRSHAYGRQGCWIARRLGVEAAHVAAVGPYGARNHSANEFNTQEYLLRCARLVAGTIAEWAQT